MDELSIDSTHLIGNSMGTSISLQLCSDFPERIKRAVLCAPIPKLTTIARYRSQILTKALESGIDRRLFVELTLPWLFSNHMFEDPKITELLVVNFLEDPHPQPLEGWKAQLAALSAFEIGECAHKIPHEILLLAGENDLFTPPDGAEWLCDQILNAQLTILKGQGHAFIKEKQAEVLSLTQKFLTGK
ncbi:MAG: 4,5:9,10-diseco-3-hydroxy-5,9,17-trioxoandrosta-1(10),2-diene-4-oate hydrolase [Chlamydiae bacterium]|nr:4,5:9,10-diseco-3-hydroxy-5,9,17-trioxoandrosta-1(10),2-diene-4-oate hydrolase [Chlamydiota bacterium]